MKQISGQAHADDSQRTEAVSNGCISKGILSKLFLFGCLLHSYVFQDSILLLITQKVKCISVAAYSIFVIRSASAIVLLERFYSGNLC